MQKQLVVQSTGCVFMQAMWAEGQKEENKPSSNSK